MFYLSSSAGNGNPMCISKASGPIHVINVATRNVEGCLPNRPVTIWYAFQIGIHFFYLAGRFPFVSSFCGSDTLAMSLVNGGIRVMLAIRMALDLEYQVNDRIRKLFSSKTVVDSRIKDWVIVSKLVLGETESMHCCRARKLSACLAF